MNDFWPRLDAVRRDCNVLGHPFYVRWSGGALTRAELRAYAGQYAYAVGALADAAARAAALADTEDARIELSAHAAEEREHVALWGSFASAVGADEPTAATPETEDCVAAWAGADRDLLEHLVAIYALEAGQPAISETKRTGLVQFYGIPQGAGTAYFDVHVERDREHAAAGRRLIEERLDGADHDRLLAAARSALHGNWRLLDGVA